MNRIALRALACGLVVVAVGRAGGSGGGGSGDAGDQVTSVADVSGTITIDPDVGEILSPPPVDASPGLTAAQAWAAYTKVDTSYRSPEIPPGVKAELGSLTLPIGPTGQNGTEQYTANGELVYGFSWHSCPVSRNPKVRKLPPNPCVEWNFLDASSGHQIDETWQMSN